MTATAKKSSRNPMTAVCPIRGMWKSRWKRQPKASMMVRKRMVKPQKVKAWATPGTVHCSSFFWPPTSTSSALTRLGTSANRRRHGRLTGGDESVEPEESAAGDGEHHRGDPEP